MNRNFMNYEFDHNMSRKIKNIEQPFSEPPPHLKQRLMFCTLINLTQEQRFIFLIYFNFIFTQKVWRTNQGKKYMEALFRITITKLVVYLSRKLELQFTCK